MAFARARPRAPATKRVADEEADERPVVDADGGRGARHAGAGREIAVGVHVDDVGDAARRRGARRPGRSRGRRRRGTPRPRRAGRARRRRSAAAGAAPGTVPRSSTEPVVPLGVVRDDARHVRRERGEVDLAERQDARRRVAEEGHVELAPVDELLDQGRAGGRSSRPPRPRERARPGSCTTLVRQIPTDPSSRTGFTMRGKGRSHASPGARQDPPRRRGDAGGLEALLHAVLAEGEAQHLGRRAREGNAEQLEHERHRALEPRVAAERLAQVERAVGLELAQARPERGEVAVDRDELRVVPGARRGSRPRLRRPAPPAREQPTRDRPRDARPRSRRCRAQPRVFRGCVSMGAAAPTLPAPERPLAVPRPSCFSMSYRPGARRARD